MTVDLLLLHRLGGEYCHSESTGLAENLLVIPWVAKSCE